MSTKISGEKYAAMYGPTTGDKVRLADTSLVIEVEKIIPITVTKSSSAAAKPSVTAWDSL